MKRKITQVVDELLCHSCGTCVYICPTNAIVMKETLGGLLHPQINETVCNNCGLCFKVCPGNHLLKKVEPQVDPFKGEVLAAYCGKAVDQRTLKNGQSGGIATSLLFHLLDTQVIEKALVTEMAQDGSLIPVCHFTEEKQKIAGAQGSKYCPVPLNSFLPQPELWKSKTFAVVGLPCHFHGISNILSVCKNLHRPLLIGLICDRTLSYAAIDYLINVSHTRKKNVGTIRFRDKLIGGWPGNVSVKCKDNSIVSVETKHRMWCKSIFTPSRCYLCFDKMNLFADIVLGDSWGVGDDREGISVILARTIRGHEVIKNAINDAIIKVDQIDSSAIFRGQHIEEKKKELAAYNAIMQEKRKKIPDFGISSKWHGSITGIDLKHYEKKLAIATKLGLVVSRKGLLIYAKKGYIFSRIKRKALGVTKDLTSWIGNILS